MHAWFGASMIMYPANTTLSKFSWLVRKGWPKETFILMTLTTQGKREGEGGANLQNFGKA